MDTFCSPHLESLFDHGGHLTELAANRHLLGELSGEAAQAVLDHLQECGDCRDYVDRLNRFDDAFTSSDLYARVLETTRHNAGSALVQSTDLAEVIPLGGVRSRATPRRWMGWLAAATVLLASITAIHLAVELTRPAQQEQDNTLLDLSDEPDTIRRKGGTRPFLEIWVHDGTQSHRLRSGERAHPGDRVGFKVFPADSGHLMIVGIDESSSAYLCYPQHAEGRSAAIDGAEGGVSLDQAMRLDELLGRERFVAVYCPSPFDFAKVKAQIEQWSLSPGDPLPEIRQECVQDEVIVVKTRKEE